jgi:hypothetical protein
MSEESNRVVYLWWYRRYTAAERDIIFFLQEKWGRPPTQGEIDFQLDLAKTILGPDLTG